MLIALSGGVLAGCGGGSASPSAPGTVTTDRLPAGTTITVVSGETAEAVGGARLVVAGRTLQADGRGQATLTEAVSVGSLVDVVAAGFLDRQTLVRSDRLTRYVLWPRTSASGVDETFTAEIVYTAGTLTPPASGSTPLRRLRAGTTRAYLVVSEQIHIDDGANAAHEAAVNAINEALRGRVVYALAPSRPSEGVVFESRVDPNDQDCQGGQVRAFATVFLTGSEITGGRMVFCGLDAARTATVAHELGHTFGLQHSPDTRELMYMAFSASRNARFGDRESLAMQLLLERRGGNRFPDSDRDVSTSAERTLTIACP